ncbi:glutamyl-tRNA amidotransferase [Photorhabdus hindustanensis]|uniref:Glutamyl-tRNA amidotransferase n=1 Tax=Photorhabdus hindustanensis TaxID=2918802 RepID=A0A2S8PU24_9GAMM|nr:glutamyl-tRNA amidotransferase [Photorhabdus hindustanensis]PQQ22294.1 glutamyl-tRNA amidotransferase [Photorhabdus hindustanensis]
MNKNTESLISACHELARVASCDDYLILNEIADKLEFLRKERDSYKEMFYDSCKGLAAIARAAGIEEENDTGSPGQVIAEIKLLKRKLRVLGLAFDALEPIVTLLQEQESKKNDNQCR